MADELVQKMHMMDASPAETEFINDGPDFCDLGQCVRWMCRECGYQIYGSENKPPIKYCPMCGRKVKCE